MKKYFITIALLFSIGSSVQILQADEFNDDLEAMEAMDTGDIEIEVSWTDRAQVCKNLPSLISEAYPKSTITFFSLIIIACTKAVNKELGLGILAVAAYPFYKSGSVLYQEYVESEETEEEQESI
ncbi:hypothetical protein JKY79_03280 [Candidatus Babeliales bacterium]|nr:hypothetical protein [Candidatus Babeliales bacterium]